MLVAIDIGRLFLVSKTLSIKVDHAALLEVLREYVASEGGEARFVGFSLISESNTRQVQFLQKLVSLGVEMHLFNVETHAPSVIPASIAYVAGSELGAGGRVLMVSDAEELIPVSTLLYASRDRVGISFFSSTLSGAWAQKILRDQVRFLDLADYTTMRRIVM
jgi:hypothetical protein